jgi:hypothetical protein
MTDKLSLSEPPSDDEIFDSITVRPEESASQPTQSSQLRCPNDETASSITITSAATTRSVDTYTTVAMGKSRSRRSHVWDPENGVEYRDEKGKRRWRCQRCRCFFLPNNSPLTDLGANPRTAATFSDGSTKNAIIHLHDVHRIGKDGPLPPIEQTAQRIRLAFGNTLPRVSFNVDVFKDILTRWMAMCDVPFVAVEHECFRLLLSYLAACVSTHSSVWSPFAVLILLGCGSHCYPEAPTAIRRHHSNVDFEHFQRRSHRLKDFTRTLQYRHSYFLRRLDIAEPSKLFSCSRSLHRLQPGGNQECVDRVSSFAGRTHR